MQNSKPIVLIVLDGWGHIETSTNNAIAQAKKPIWDNIWSSCPHILLEASGLDVGLPPGQMGNSEVGHMTMGAGRVIYQDLTRINNSIADGSFFDNQVLLNAFNKAKLQHTAVHVLGLLSPGGVHSHEQHIAALLQMAQQNSVAPIYLHAFLDGRDTPPKSAMTSIQKFEPYIASIIGRFYAMDRDKRIERTQAAIDLLVHGKTAFTATSATDALQMAYERGETDEFVQATQIKNVTINPGDIVIFMNFRTDRARQLSYALLAAQPNLGALITLTEYDPNLTAQVVFPPQQTNDTLSEILAKQHLTQLHIAETEKYAHVTFFFNAGREMAVSGEERVLIPSPKVTTYDLQPAMSALQITDKIVAAIKQQTYDVIICNYANADMVGHTGNLPATIQAIEVIDQYLGKLVTAAQEVGATLLITADHGNAEIMWDSTTQQPHTAHTTNLVPFIYVGPNTIIFKTDKTYGLQDVAPTILDLLQIPKPGSMTGCSLLAKILN